MMKTRPSNVAYSVGGSSRLYYVFSCLISFVFWLSARRAATHRGDGAVAAEIVVDGEADGDDDDDGGDN